MLILIKWISRRFDREPYVRWFGHFERYLRTSGGGPFVLGSELCYADIALYDCITAIWVGNYGMQSCMFCMN
jgi:hypothetical protein